MTVKIIIPRENKNYIYNDTSIELNIQDSQLQGNSTQQSYNMSNCCGLPAKHAVHGTETIATSTACKQASNHNHCFIHQKDDTDTSQLQINRLSL
jgi:hypothetical protein